MSDPIHQFVIEPRIPLEIGGIDLSFTNSSLWMAIALVTSTTLLTLATSKNQMIPGRAQVAAEMIYGFIANMVRENLGPRGQEYFPLIFTLFMLVLTGNMLGMLPYSFTYTSHLIVTGALALVIFLTVMVIGIARHGTHFFDLFVPPGVPAWLLPLILPIEILSFLVRPITLAMRLFANMMAGHLILKVFAGFSVAMLTSFGVAGFFMALLPAGFNVILISFEFLVAFLQAYVFSILACIYLKDTIEIAH
ncbi:MAG: F0F1 ATP synthase subunit A [Alphaproteobacteria bacterium]